jgi:hypothetical protein
VDGAGVIGVPGPLDGVEAEDELDVAGEGGINFGIKSKIARLTSDAIALTYIGHRSSRSRRHLGDYAQSSIARYATR